MRKSHLMTAAVALGVFDLAQSPLRPVLAAQVYDGTWYVE